MTTDPTAQPTTTPSHEGTVGDFRYGLASAEDHARFTESLYRSIDDMREWGAIPGGTGFVDVAEALLDTFAGYTEDSSIAATDLPTLLRDALGQIREENAATTTPTPAPVAVPAEPWELRVLPGGPERWMLDDEADVAKVVDAMVDAGAWQLFELTMDTADRSPSEAEVRKAAEEVRAALRSAVAATPLSDIEAMPIRERDELVAAVLRFMTVRGYVAAGFTLPAAAQRARDEGTVRRAVLDAIEDPGRDDENPASRERIAGWRACAQDVRDALDSVEDDDTVRVPREAVERLVESFRAWQRRGSHQAFAQGVVNFLETADEGFRP